MDGEGDYLRFSALCHPLLAKREPVRFAELYHGWRMVELCPFAMGAQTLVAQSDIRFEAQQVVRREIPTTLAFGAHDPLTPEEDRLRWQGLLPHARTFVEDNGGHLLLAERPAFAKSLWQGLAERPVSLAHSVA